MAVWLSKACETNSKTGVGTVCHMDTRFQWAHTTVKRLGPDVDNILVTENSADLDTKVQVGQDHAVYCQKRNAIISPEFTSPKSAEVHSTAKDGGGLVSLRDRRALLCAALVRESGGSWNHKKA